MDSDFYSVSSKDIIDVVKRMGGNIEILNTREVSGELVADIRVQYTEDLKSCEISGADIPRLIDELPVLAVLASQSEGETIVKNAGDLRNKETDRVYVQAEVDVVAVTNEGKLYRRIPEILKIALQGAMECKD